MHLMFKEGMGILQIDTAINIALSTGNTLCSRRSASVSFLAWEPRNDSSGPWGRAKQWTSYCVMSGIARLTIEFLRLMALWSTLHKCCLAARSVSCFVLQLPSLPHGRPNTDLQQLLWVCRLTAHEALSYGLVSRVVSPDRLIPEAHSMVDKMASLSILAIAKAKDCINRAYEVPLSEGLRYEQCVPLS